MKDRDQLPLIPAGGRFEGLLTFRGAAIIDGEVVGPVEGAGRLRLGEGATVRGPVVVDELESAGSIQGDVTARDVARFDTGATLRGTLDAPRARVANGALIQGRCSIGRHSD